MKRTWTALLALTLLSGCVGLPSAGGVQEGLERAPEPEGIVFLAPDPEPGGSPEEIVSGFLDAATAGVADRFETAQKYLTEEARRAWVPGRGVTIYAGSTPPVVEQQRDGRVSVSVSVAGIVDEHGIYAEEPADSTHTAYFDLSRVDGQWRIQGLEDGVLISAVNFGTQYRQVALAFFSQDGAYIIPDPRWFPEQNSASFAAGALLAGPAQWLLPGVRTAVPPGTTAEPVSVVEGTAEVRLSPAALAASPEDRAALVAQLDLTLTQLPQVRRVRPLVDGVPLIDGMHGLNPISDPSVGHVPVVLRDEELVTISGTTVTPLEGVSVGGEQEYTALAVPYGDLQTVALPIVALVGTGAIVAFADDGSEAATLIEGEKLLRPSYDPQGWVWSGPQNNTGTLVVTRPGSGVVSVVAAPSLADDRVRAVRVSRDGSRIAMIHEVDGEATIQVGMVLREEDGTPLEVTEPVTIGHSVRQPTDLVWVDAVTLAALGTNDEGAQAIYTVPIGGPSVALLSVPGAVSIASGRGERELWVLTSEGHVYNRAGNGWRRAGDDGQVRAIAFPG